MCILAKRNLVYARFVLRAPQIPDAHLGAQAFVVFTTSGVGELSFQFISVDCEHTLKAF